VSRILDLSHCPHCGADLQKPTPRSCPACAGSLQRRYLEWGCLSSKPLWLLGFVSVYAVLHDALL
jgi:predicted amidophosphoribosyltransferase